MQAHDRPPAAPPSARAPAFFLSSQVTAGKEHAQEKRVCFFSLRSIRPGEELFYSYPAPHNIGLGAAIVSECACRASGCRGRMSKREDRL